MRTVFLSLLASLLCACASSAGGTTEPNAGTPTTIAADKVGGYCELAGSPGYLSSAKNPSCASGLCLYDGLRELTQAKTGQKYFEAYCSADCTNATCPAGWQCVGNDVGAKVCAKIPAVCGDGVVQLDEACDDGNTYAHDGCSSDCTTVLPGGVDVVTVKLGGGTGSRWYPSLGQETKDGWAVVENVTPQGFLVRFLVASVSKSISFDLRVPRAVGVVKPDATFGPGLSDANAISVEAPSMTVLEAGTDGRSYRVVFAGKIPSLAAFSGEVVVTLAE